MNKEAPSMPEQCNIRMTLAIGMLVLSTWIFARLISKSYIHWALFVLAWSAIGVVIGAIVNNVRGAIIGGTIGMILSGPLLIFDIFLWLFFTLPPYLEGDL